MTVTAYKYAPLLMSLVDIRMTAIPDFYLDDKLTHIESSLREIGFVEKVIEKRHQIEFEIKHEPESGQLIQTQKPQPTGARTERWIFLNLDKTTSIYLSQDGVSIKTTHYTTHVEFVNLIHEVLNRLVDIFPLALKGAVSRIGTRYVNLIVPKPGRDVCEYLKEEWLPNNKTSEAIKAEEGTHSRLIMNYKTEHGGLRLDVHKFSPTQGEILPIIPQELADNPESALNINELPWWKEQMIKNESYLMFDIDLGKVTREMFDIQRIVTSLNDMRALTKPAFEMCITDAAREDWVLL